MKTLPPEDASIGAVAFLRRSSGFRLMNTIVAGNGSSGAPTRVRHFSVANNLIGNSAGSVGFNAAGDKAGSSAAPLDPKAGILSNNGGNTDTMALLPGSPAIDSGNDANAPATDQRGLPRFGVSDIGAFEVQPPPPTPTPTPTPVSQLANISTRLRVETGDNVLIGGFIITGTQPKKVIIRAIGPSSAG